MSYLLIIGIILFALVVLLLLKLLKHVIKAVIISLVLFFLVCGLFAYLTYSEVRGFNTNTNIYLMDYNGQLMTGFTMYGLNTSSLQMIDLQNLTPIYPKDLKMLRGQNHRLLIFYLNNITDTEDPVDLLEGTSILFNKIKNDPKYLITLYRKEFVLIYPESLILKLLKL